MSCEELEELFTRCVELSKDVSANFICLARSLCQLQFESRDHFAEFLQLDVIDRRTAYYLITLDLLIWQVGDEARLKEIGWSKLSILVRFAKSTNYKELLHYAETHTARDLALVLAGKPVIPNARCMLLYMSPEDYAFVENVLFAFGATKRGKGLVGKEDALLAALKRAVASFE